MSVRVGPSEIHGIGVFALAPVAAGDIIETCPVLVIPAADLEAVDTTSLYNYYYGWPDPDGPDRGALALGYGSLYNHSSNPNADYVKDPSVGVIQIVAVRPVAPGDEVTVDYSRDGTNPLWFDPNPD